MQRTESELALRELEEESIKSKFEQVDRAYADMEEFEQRLQMQK